MRRCFVAVVLLLGLVVSACGVKLPSPDDVANQFSGGEPKTLDAATRATQEFVDRRAAGDYAGVWLMYDEQIQSGISQADYVTLSQTCGSNLEKIPVTATGVRLVDDTHALVRVKPLGFSIQLPVVYEDGKWVMAPSDEFAADLGKPVQQIIADRKAAKSCGDDALSSRLATPTQVPATPSSTTVPQSPVNNAPGGSCSVDVPGCEGYDECHPVVTGQTDCFPENESCSKPGNNFPWCLPNASSQTATASPAVAPGTQYAFPSEYSPYAPASERPVDLKFDHRFHTLTHMVWSSWGPAGAQGDGVEVIQTDCTPDCASGTTFRNPVTVFASNAGPAASDSGCPSGVLFYRDVVIAYPSTVPQHDAPSLWTENNPNMEWTTYNGMTAAHYPDRLSTCVHG